MSNTDFRLNKAIADAGICSRRKADELIFKGKVSVNGVIADSPGNRIDIAIDKVECNGKPVVFSPSKKACWLLLHKPVSVVSTVSDPEGRETVLDFVPPAWSSRRLYPVGRLDFFSEGLVLITDDGELAHRLTHPRWHLPRIYEVRVRLNHNNFDLNKALDTMEQGMTLAEGETLAPAKIRLLKDFRQEEFSKYDYDRYDDSYQGQDKDTRGVLIEMTLYQGLNRQIRRMCRDLDMTVLRLKRVSQGPIHLGNLPVGKVRELGEAEVSALRKAVDLLPE